VRVASRKEVAADRLQDDLQGFTWVGPQTESLAIRAVPTRQTFQQRAQFR